jgi:hypothetical protein
LKRHEELGLPGPDDKPYWEKIEVVAKYLGTDGCSGPAFEVYVRACWEHDIHYRTGQTLYGLPLTRADADAIFRERHQEFSVFGRLSPMSWWRWLGLRIGGGSSWKGVSEARGPVPVGTAPLQLPRLRDDNAP